MTEENVTSPAGEVAPETLAPIPQEEPRDDNARADAANAERQQSAQVETETNAEGAEVAAEEFELDVAGTKHKFPKGTPIEAAIEKVQAYSKGLEAELTRKSQGIAAERKAIEEAGKVAQRLQTLGLEQARDIARGKQLAETIEYYDRPDVQQAINALWQSEPDKARQHSDARSAALSEFQQIERRLAQYGTQRNEAERQAVEVRAREGEAIVAKAIKGWNAQAEAELIDYVTKQGVSKEEAANWKLHPLTTQWAWESMQYRKLQAQAKSAAKPPAPVAPSAPVTSIKGGKSSSSGPVDLEKMSMDEYAAYMARREGRRASR